MTPTKPLHRFRIKQPGRTIHISSAVDPSQWHVHSRDTVYALQKISDNPISDRSTRRTNPVIPSRDPVERRRENAVHQVSNSKPSSARTRILFYHKNDPYYGFTNFSPHPVMDGGKRYPTSEHLFQASKFLPHRPDLAERIRNCASPRDALSMARSNQNAVRADWKKVNIRMMDITLFFKFRQHLDLQAELLGTGDAELIENSDKDAFWGVGQDGKGRNELGKCLERLRAALPAYLADPTVLPAYLAPRM